MGWLKELMGEMKPPASSFTALANRVLASPKLRSRSTLKPRSLATYLGKLDDEKDLAVLDEHPNERRVLAELLDLSLEEFDERLQERKAPRAQPKNFRLDLSDIRVAPIDLRTDELPPGIPLEVLMPQRWPLWWSAPSGSGRTLAGRWLEARGLATFIQADSWEAAEPQLTPGSPCFVELSSPLGVPRPEELVELRFCVAVDGMPLTIRSVFGSTERVVDPSWSERIVHPPPVRSWLEELLRYLDERVPSDSRFDTRQCLEWMRQELLPNGLIDGLGAALGFAGLFAAYHHHLKRDSGPTKFAELTRRFLRLRKQQLEPATVIAPLQLWAALLRMGQGLLTQGELPWNAARDLSSWYELAHTQPDTLDRRWLQEPQVRERLRVEEHTLKKALDALPPDAYRTIQSLRELKLLREHQPRSFALSPPWLLHVMIEESAEELLGEAPSEWGAALLHAHGAPRILMRLTKRCDRQDFEPFRRLLRSPEPDSTTWVAALEGSVRVLGLALLLGHPVPEDIVAPVFDWQQRLAITRYGGDPHPRLAFNNSRDELLLSRGLWLAACHALSEKLERRPGWRHPILAPWGGVPPLMDPSHGPEPVQRALSELWDVARHKQARPVLRLAILSLGARLLGALGPRPSHMGPVSAVLAPEFLLRHFRAGTLSWDMLGLHTYWYEILPMLPAYLEQQGVVWEHFARAIWKAWLVSGKDANPLFHGGEKHLLLWKHLPAAVLLDARFTGLLFHELIPFESFQTEHWDAFLTLWKQGTYQHAGSERNRPWRCMPESHVRRSISEGLLDPYVHDVYQILWERMPEVVLEELRALVLRERWEDTLQLAWHAPANRMRNVLAILEEFALLQPDVPHERLVHWLHMFIGQRAPGWEEAWKSLGRLMRASVGVG